MWHQCYCWILFALKHGDGHATSLGSIKVHIHGQRICGGHRGKPEASGGFGRERWRRTKGEGRGERQRLLGIEYQWIRFSYPLYDADGVLYLF